MLVQLRSRLVIQALVALGLVVLFPHAAYAAPPRPVVVTLSQPDGSPFRARAWGDERSHGMETLDGYTILLDSQSKYWVYAVRSSVGVLTPARGPQGNLVVGRASPAALPKFARPAAPVRKPTAPRAYARPNMGTQYVLVILVNFQDRALITTEDEWNAKFFGATDSVKSYYAEASYGDLIIAPAAETYGTANDGVVVVTLGYDHPNGSSDQYVYDAIMAAAPYVNFADFDTNGNGYISFDELHIAVVAAGDETSYGDCSPTPSVWAHEDSFVDGTEPVVSGEKVADWSGNGGYTTFGEMHCDSSESDYLAGGHQATIGIPSHELGHDLGLPDLYDTSDEDIAGVGDWSIMSTGAWNASGGYAGSSPAHPDPWSRWYEGWITPTQISGYSPGMNIPQIETSPTVFQFLDNPYGVDWLFESHPGTGEYFLAENRQKIGYDAGIPGCGLLIWHIDESVTDTNSANAIDPPLVYLEQADGLGQLNIDTGNRGDAGDPFPGTTGNRTFNAASNPNSNLYSGVPSGVTITNISNCSPTMTLSTGYWFYFPFVGKHSP